MSVKKAFAVILLLSFSASAWGPSTHQYICNQAVEQLWGPATVTQCLPRKSSKFMDEFCERVYRMSDAPTYRECRNSYKQRNFMHPANLPDDLLNDTANFHDYTRCPIRPGPSRYLLCGSKDDDAAPRQARRWFDAAEKESEACMRAYLFCVGSNYYAKAENPLNQMKGESQECYDAIVGGIEDRIIDGAAEYRATKRCEFEDSSYEHRIGVTEKLINDIIDDLVAVGSNFSSGSSLKDGGVVFLANSIDFGLNSEYFETLKTRGLTVTYATSENFQTLRYADKIVVLGGHHSADGVGEIVDSILTSTEKQKLLSSQDSFVLASHSDLWKMNQKIWVLAGYEKEQTAQAVKEHGEKVIGEIMNTI